MTNSYVTLFLGLYNAILTDCEGAYPSLAKEFRRDKLRLETAASSRGLHLFTIDLPAIGKFFETCLKYGNISDIHTLKEVKLPVYEPLPGDPKSLKTVVSVPDVLPMNGRRSGSLIPRLFGGLWALVFDHKGLELKNSDETAVLFLRQLYNAAKKVEFDCPPSKVYKAVEEFVAIERDMRLPSCDWDGLVLDTRSDIALSDGLVVDSLPLLGVDCSSYDRSDLEPVLKTVQFVCDVLSSQFGPFDPDGCHFKHGPGVVSDAPKGDKYLFPNWPEKLDRVFSFGDYAFVNHQFWGDWALGTNERKTSNHEPPSRLISVPKTQKGPRLIAAEPTAHQWCQQALRDFLEKRVPSTSLRGSVSFRTQEFSRDRALTASKTGRHATIDLSSASDRLSVWTVERCFRSNPSLLGALHAVRTRWIVNAIDKKSPKFIKLRKFATQGSAVTFPIQTICYAMVAIGVLYHLSGRYHPGVGRLSAYLGHLGKEVTVFGDDIIVPVHSSHLLVEVLQHLGLRVNHDKSFSEGNFRESCGMDAYKGFDVTPAYVRRVVNPKSPESIVSFIECSNNFFEKGFWHTAEWMQSWLATKFKTELPVVKMHSGLFGWASFVGQSSQKLRSRWNGNLHRTEYHVHESYGTVQRGSQTEESSLFQYFTENPNPDSKWTRGWVERVAVKFRLRWSPLLTQ